MTGGSATTLGRAVRAIFSVTLLSRLGGLARDVIVGRVFGDTWVNSAFAAAFAIPNLFRRLFGEGALSAAFIPAYARARAVSPREAGLLARSTLLWLGAVTGGLTVVIELGLLAVLVLAGQDAERGLSLRLMMLMLPFMPMICVTAVLAGMLQVHGRWAASASGPLVLNGFIIATGAYFLFVEQRAGERVAYAFGVATVLSGLTQAVWFALLLRREVRWQAAHGANPEEALAVAAARERLREMGRKFMPVMVGLGTLQLATLADTLICMWPIWVGPSVAGVAYPLDEKANGIVALTSRLYQFPLGVFGIAVATAVFPLLSAAAAREEHLAPGASGGGVESFVSTLRRGLRLALFIGLPASVGLVLVRHDLVYVLFRGEASGFSVEGVQRSAAVLLGYAPAVWAYSLNHVLTRGFYARGDTSTPMRVSVAMVGVNLCLTLVLIWPLAEAGLGWSTAITAVVQCVVLTGLLARRESERSTAGQERVSLLDGATTRAFARIVACSAVMAGVCVGTQLAWVMSLGEPGRWREHLLRLTAVVALGVVAYVAASWTSRSGELSLLLGRRGRRG